MSWRDVDNMTLGVSVDGGSTQTIDVRPFGPFEVQLWRDNFLVVPDAQTGFRISHMNFPEGWRDPFHVGRLAIYERRVHLNRHVAAK